MKNFLIVEDQPMMIDGLKANLLDYYGEVEVHGAISTKEALEVMNDPNLHIDLIIVDIELQEVMNGLQLIELLKKQGRKMKSLVCSSYDLEEYIRRSLAIEVDGYVLKGTVGEEFANIIRQVLDGEKYFPEKLIDQIRLPEEIRNLLSDRQLEIYDLVLAGYSSREIADSLKISINTVRGHRGHINTLINAQKSERLKGKVKQLNKKSKDL